MDLGRNIKSRRQELKLSQEYVAEKLGVSRQAVAKWEKGQSGPTAANLAALAKLLEVSLSELTAPDYREAKQKFQRKSQNPVWRTNTSILAIACQAGMLYSCTRTAYVMAGDERVEDHRFMLFKAALLLLCSIWMALNLAREKDAAQRRKNSIIELAYCCVQLAAALAVYRFRMGLMGLICIVSIALVYILYINPKYMRRDFGKRRASH